MSIPSESQDYSGPSFAQLQCYKFTTSISFHNRGKIVTYDMNDIVSFTQENLNQYGVVIRLTEANANDMLSLNENGREFALVKPEFRNASGTEAYPLGIHPTLMVTNAKLAGLGSSAGGVYLTLYAATSYAF